MGIPENWLIGLTPRIAKLKENQKALDWWHSLPVQDLQIGLGWANLCMKYFPGKTECYHFTEEEIKFIFDKETN